MGNRGKPCGIAMFTNNCLEIKSISFRMMVRSCKKLLIHCSIRPPIFLLQRLWKRRDCETLSKVSVISKKSRIAIFFIFQTVYIDSSNRCNACLRDALFFSSMWLLSRNSNILAAQLKQLATIKLKVFPILFSSVIGRYALRV